MPRVTDEKIKEVALVLWKEIYEANFRGKERGRFCLTRDQLKTALDTQTLHQPTVARLQQEALELGLVVIDLDDLFPCIEVDVVRKYRRPPAEIFRAFFPGSTAPDTAEDEA